MAGTVPARLIRSVGFKAATVTATTCVSSPHRSSTNTNRRPLMSESYSLPTEPEGVIPSLIERFNSGKVSAMETLYEGAVLIADDGRTQATSDREREVAIRIWFIRLTALRSALR